MDRIKNRITNYELRITNKKVLSLFIFLILNSIFLIQSANAARIFFEPTTNTHEVGESFTVNVKLDTQGENINAVDLNIMYPPVLEVRSISKSGSVIQLWVQEPSYTSSGIVISGGSPGGIKSSNALIAKVTVRAKAIGEGVFQLTPASSVLLNDGQGTNATLTTVQASFNVTAQPKKEPTPTLTPKSGESVKPSPSSTVPPLVSPEDEEQKEEIPKDTNKPKNFKIFLGQDPRVFEGKYFISFFTTDSKSGINHYEVKEGDSEYKIAQSPYLLSDQDLRSVIHVRAYDGAGNYREVVYQGILKRMWLWIIHLF